MIDLDLTPYIARLREQMPQLQEVGGAAEFDRVLSKHAVPPSAYVIYLGGRAQPESARCAGVHRQQVAATFEVFICERNVADVFGAEAEADMRPLREGVLKALTGWTPDPACLEPLDRTTDRLWVFDQGVIWWRLAFATGFLMTIKGAA